jgi:TetR/AcrR family transcriptional regulator, repressor for uid operon
LGTIGAARPPENDALSERHIRILDAAERCFVRAGFHRTTMQDVAAEAGMSPGNLYRYFPSKDAIVAGLAERDRTEIGRDFGEFDHPDRDFMATFVRLARKHFQDEPREKAVLCLEIWAEATRNPAIAAISADFDREMIGHLTALLEEAKSRGKIAASVDPGSAAIVISLLANGLFVRRAVAPSYDAEREIAHMIDVIRAMLDGSLGFSD